MNPKKTEVIVVAGLASKGANLAPLRYTAERIADSGTIHYVDGGVPNSLGGHDVASPTEQTFQIAEILNNSPKEKFVMLSQSMGALASLTCLEAYSSYDLQAISIAPPLTHPDKVARHPRMLARIKAEEDGYVLPSYSFALGEEGPTNTPPPPARLRVLQSVYTDIDEQSPLYLQRTVAAVASGALQIVMPTHDWNTSALAAAGDLPHVHFVEGPHSLQTDDALLEHNIRTIASLVQR